MKLFSHLLEQLQHSRIGRIWCYNLYFDWYHKKLEEPIISAFFTVFPLNSASFTSDQKVSKAILKVLVGDPTFDLRGCKGPRKLAERYSRVVDLKSFVLFNDTRGKRQAAHAQGRAFQPVQHELGLEISGRMPHGQVWENLSEPQVMQRIWEGLGTPEASNHYTDQLQGKRKFFWCTPTRRLLEVQQAQPDENAAATEIYQLLGLNLLLKDQRLVRIDLPERLPDGVTVRAPTVFDAVPDCAFLPAQADDEVGWTFHLREHKPAAEEVVVSSIAFSKDCAATRIGRILKQADIKQVWTMLEKLTKERYDDAQRTKKKSRKPARRPVKATPHR